MATRGKPHVAAAVVNAGQFFSSGAHEIVWILGHDSDDDLSARWFNPSSPLFNANVTFTDGPRPAALGTVWNRCAAAAPADTDIYCTLVDDGLIGSLHWDAILVDRIKRMPPQLAVVSWQASDDMGNMGHPCFTSEWYRRAGFFTEHFPFWWDDTWLAETWSFVTGNFIPIVPELRLISGRPSTRRMRDVRFWCEFFTETRGERLAKAAAIRADVGIHVAASRLEELVRYWEERDRRYANFTPQMEQRYSAAADNDSTPLYLEARARALLHIAGTQTAKRWSV